MNTKSLPYPYFSIHVLHITIGLVLHNIPVYKFVQGILRKFNFLNHEAIMSPNLTEIRHNLVGRDISWEGLTASPFPIKLDPSASQLTSFTTVIIIERNTFYNIDQSHNKWICNGKDTNTYTIQEIYIIQNTLEKS